MENKMDQAITKAINEYQCSGCLHGGIDCGCYIRNTGGGSGCCEHVPGTTIYPDGLIFLGMPKGFNRIGFVDRKACPLLIFSSNDEFTNDWSGYDVFDIPVWKHLNDYGHTLVRGLSPRNNRPFIHVHLYNCMDTLNCPEITQDMIDAMD